MMDLLERPKERKARVKLWGAISMLIFMLIAFGLAGRAYGELRVAILKTTALDASGNPELHLLFCGIPMQTTRLLVRSDASAVQEILWSWKNGTADLWLAIGEWETLTLQIVYADNSRDTVTIKASPKGQTYDSAGTCGAGNVL